MENQAKVGVGVMIVKDGKILLGERRGSHGEGEFSWPGGHLEYMESIFECARRETYEETGIEIDNIRFLCITNLMDYDPKHYVDIGIIADWKSGEPQILEPEKVRSWDWYAMDELPHPLFKSIPNYLTALNTAKIFFDA